MGKGWINKECSWCIFLHLNIREWFTRLHWVKRRKSHFPYTFTLQTFSAKIQMEKIGKIRFLRSVTTSNQFSLQKINQAKNPNEKRNPEKEHCK
jgi:hypothetical protein